MKHRDRIPERRSARASARRQLFGAPSAAAQSTDCVCVKTKQTCSKTKGVSLPPASQSTCTCSHVQCCALPTWWSWRGGCTRSHSEHGRETPLRRWYFVLRRGRVGRCQVCKAQHLSSQLTKLATAAGRNRGPFFALCRELNRSRLVVGWSSPSRTAEAKASRIGKQNRASPEAQSLSRGGAAR